MVDAAISRVTKMIIRRDQPIDENIDIYDYGFEFQHYLRDGTKKYLDSIGNAILESRAGIVAMIYSQDAGGSVEVLELPESTHKRRWPKYTSEDAAEYEQEMSRRRKELRPAWDQLMASLPAPENVSEDLRSAVLNLREDLETAIVWGREELWSGEDNSLADSHDAVECIKKMYPAANVSGLVIQIARAATDS